MYDPGNECKEKEQKEQEYCDCKCSNDVCTYSVTDTQWQETGNMRNKADSTICGCTANNTLKRCYNGNCTNTGACNTTICGADFACDGKAPGDSCAGGICNSTCNCVSFVTAASYANISAVIDTWNVSAIATNANGTDMQTWTWTVTSPCFIATAAYGTPLHEDIGVLRAFRDEYLMLNPVGQAFVKIYYSTSPPIANVIRDNECVGIAVRAGFVKPVVQITRWFVD